MALKLINWKILGWAFWDFGPAPVVTHTTYELSFWNRICKNIGFSFKKNERFFLCREHFATKFVFDLRSTIVVNTYLVRILYARLGRSFLIIKRSTLKNISSLELFSWLNIKVKSWNFYSQKYLQRFIILLLRKSFRIISS